MVLIYMIMLSFSFHFEFYDIKASLEDSVMQKYFLLNMK